MNKFCAMAAVLAVTSSALGQAGPGGGSNPYALGLNLSIHETAGGLPSEVSDIVSLPAGLASGYVVLLDSGSPTNLADQLNQANWSDVLQFIPDVEETQVATGMQLFSAGAAFPSVADVLNTNHVFLLENQSGPTVYTASTANSASPDVYTIFSSEEATSAGAAPEPAMAIAALTVMGWGLVVARRPRPNHVE